MTTTKDHAVRRVDVPVVQAICLCCGLVMPLLEFIPFTSSMMGVVVSLLAFGLLARDGVFVLLGFLAIGGVVTLVLTLLP